MASTEISYQLLVPELLRFGEWIASLRARSLVRVRGKMTSPHAKVGSATNRFPEPSELSLSESQCWQPN